MVIIMKGFVVILLIFLSFSYLSLLPLSHLQQLVTEPPHKRPRLVEPEKKKTDLEIEKGSIYTQKSNKEAAEDMSYAEDSDQRNQSVIRGFMATIEVFFFFFLSFSSSSSSSSSSFPSFPSSHLFSSSPLVKFETNWEILPSIWIN